jgi:predicted lipid-binding transport protein (Tim44 family)
VRARAKIAATLAGALLALPGAALAQGPSNPFAPGVPQSPAPTPAPTVQAPTIVNPTTTTGGDSSLSGGAAIGIAVGALLLIGGISFYIWYDARKRAPRRRRAAEALAGAGGRAGSKRAPKPRKLSQAERRRRKRGRAR